MRLDCYRSYSLMKYEPNDCVVRWTVDVKADVEVPAANEPEEISVGRMLADELRRFEIDELGYDIGDVAEADSSGLESAWSAMLDEHGEFDDEDLEGLCDPLVYLYRFELHPDFSTWRLAVMDAFCRIFENNAIILAQYRTTWLSDAEFNLVGFQRRTTPRIRLAPDIEFMIRNNVQKTKFSIRDYPQEMPAASLEHSKWLDSKGPWSDLT